MIVLTKEMKGAIERSGYPFEQRLVPSIANSGFYATPNYRFRDLDGALRELDIYAIKAKRISSRRGYLWITLLIECKNLRCPIVVFSQSAPLRTTDFLGYPHISGLPQQVFQRNTLVDLPDFLTPETFHHYYTRAKVITQFCAVSERKKSSSAPSKRTSDDYVAGHQVGEIDLYGDGLLKLVHATRADKSDFANRFAVREVGDERVDLWLHYPIFVTAGALYECSVTGSRSTEIQANSPSGLLAQR